MVKIGKNLYHNLIPGPGEQKPRIELESANDGRVIWTLAELFKARGYRADADGYIETSFKEIHYIFTAGRKRAEASETAEAFQKLSERKFDLAFRIKEKKYETIEDLHLFAYDGNIRDIKKIAIGRIFRKDIDKKDGYYSFKPDFLTILLEALKEIGGERARLTRLDILLALYTRKYHHTKAPKAVISLEDIASWAGMAAEIKKRNWKRITETVEQSAKALINISFIENYRIENNDITLFFRPKLQALGRK